MKTWYERKNQGVNLNFACKLGHATAIINVQTIAKIGTMEKDNVILIRHHLYPKSALVHTTVKHFDVFLHLSCYVF